MITLLKLLLALKLLLITIILIPGSIPAIIIGMGLLINKLSGKVPVDIMA